MPDVTANKDGSVEWSCLYCGQPLLSFVGDHISVRVGDDGEVQGVLCEICVKQAATD